MLLRVDDDAAVDAFRQRLIKAEGRGRMGRRRRWRRRRAVTEGWFVEPDAVFRSRVRCGAIVWRRRWRRRRRQRQKIWLKFVATIGMSGETEEAKSYWKILKDLEMGRQYSRVRWAAFFAPWLVVVAFSVASRASVAVRPDLLKAVMASTRTVAFSFHNILYETSGSFCLIFGNI